MKKREVQALVDNFNMKLLLERSLVQLQPTEGSLGLHFEITIPEDKYIDSKIINVTSELRIMILNYFKANGCGIHWNNTGSTFRVIPPTKAI